MDSIELNAYRILYRFLKENGLMSQYLLNMLRARHPKGNSKEMLTHLVKVYFKTNGNFGENIINIFCWARASFTWEASFEGATFWANKNEKWIDFYNKHKTEYNFL
jgi:hypothetical protein